MEVTAPTLSLDMGQLSGDSRHAGIAKASRAARCGALPARVGSIVPAGHRPWVGTWFCNARVGFR